jgi:hypothetical protein
MISTRPRCALGTMMAARSGFARTKFRNRSTDSEVVPHALQIDAQPTCIPMPVGRRLPVHDEDALAGRSFLQKAGAPFSPKQISIGRCVQRRWEVVGEVPHPGTRLALHRALVKESRLMNGRGEEAVLLERLCSLVRRQERRPVGEQLLTDA